jgi:hypothetical protein
MSAFFYFLIFLNFYAFNFLEKKKKHLILFSKFTGGVFSVFLVKKIFFDKKLKNKKIEKNEITFDIKNYFFFCDSYKIFIFEKNKKCIFEAEEKIEIKKEDEDIHGYLN